MLLGYDYIRWFWLTYEIAIMDRLFYYVDKYF